MKEIEEKPSGNTGIPKSLVFPKVQLNSTETEKEKAAILVLEAKIFALEQRREYMLYIGIIEPVRSAL